MAATTTQQELGGYGQSVKRKEDPRFLRGKGTYVDDVKLPGMLYMDIARSPFAHATITNIDDPAGAGHPGRRWPSSPARISTRPGWPGCRR